MAIQFPKDGIYPGYTFDFTDKYDGTTTYIWDGQAWNAVIKQITGPKGEKGSDGEHGVKGDMAYVWIQDDAPPIGDTAAGDLWWSPKWGQLYISYDDGNSFQWVVSNAQSTGKKGEKGEFKGEKGAKGEKGEKFLFDDFTEEDREVIKGEKGAKGEYGDPFIWDDFTDEQLEAIKGEKGRKGEKGEIGREFQWDDFTDEQLEAIKGEKGQKGREFLHDDFTDDQLIALKGEPGNVTFPTGTAMLFHQANPPIDWTIDESYAENALRVTSASGFGSGGGGSLNFTDAFKSHTVSGGGSGSTDNENVSGGGGSTTGSWVYGTVQMNNFGINQMPGHQHNVNVYNGGGNLKWTSGTNYGPQDKGTTSSGGGGSHNHGWGNDSSHGHDYGGFSGSHRHNFDASFSSSINLSVKYANVIIGVKN